MADIVEAIRSRLLAHAGTSALIGTRARIDHLEQNPTMPACVVKKVSDIPTRRFGGNSDKRQARLQVNAHAATRASCFALATQMKAALDWYSGTSATVVVDVAWCDNEIADGWDDNTNTYVTVQDYLVWYTE